MLYISAFQFATVTYHAAIAGNVFMHKIGLVLYGVSILHHANERDGSRYRGGHIIAFIDRMISRAVGCYIIYNTRVLIGLPKYAIWFLLSYGGAVYYKYLRMVDNYRLVHYILHATMHLSCTTAAHIFLCNHKNNL